MIRNHMLFLALAASLAQWSVCAAQAPQNKPADRSAGIPKSLIDAVHRDAVTVLFAAGPGPNAAPGQATRSAVDLLGFVVDRAQGMGLLSSVDPAVRGWIDAITSLPLVFQHAYALVLLEVDAKSRQDGGHELAQLSAALLLKTDGSNDAVRDRIQHLLSTYTNREHTELSRDERRGTVVFSLRDRRFPSWFEIQWADIGDLFVITVGDKAFEKTLAAIEDRGSSIGADAWFQDARRRLRPSGEAALLYLRTSAIAAVGDAALSAKIARVHGALGMESVTRSLWCFSRADRAVVLTALMNRPGGDEQLTLAGALREDVEPVLIPAPASGYTAIHARPAALLSAVSQAYMASRSVSAQERIRGFWQRVEQSAAVDIQDDILAQLGSPILIHNHPEHPLRLPVNLTVTVPIRGDPAALRASLDRLLSTASGMIPAGSWLTLKRDVDGVWFVSFGLAGPAVMLTERFFVLSYSPRAVRLNTELLKSVNAEMLESLMGHDVTQAAPEKDSGPAPASEHR